MGPTDMDVNTDATSMNELVREKLVGALRVRQLQRREEALVEELEAQRRNARASAEQMEREATERRELRSEVDALRRTGEGLQGRLEAAERERRRAESRLGEANAAVAEYRKKTEELVVEKSDLTARLAQRWETLAHQHRQASEQRTIVEADKLKHFAEERARQAESHIRDLSRSNAALKGQIEVLKLEKRRNEDLQVETADLKQQLLEKTANFDGLSRKVSEMQKELQAKEKLHLTQLSRVEMEVTKLREAGDKCMQQALEAEIQFKEKLRDQELEWTDVVSSLRAALLDATNKIGALSKGHEEHVSQLKNRIVRMEKRAVRDTESTVDGIVAWKMEALQKTREAIAKAEDDARVEAKELQLKLASCCEAQARTNSELADASRLLSYEKGKTNAMDFEVQELKKLLQSVQDELAEVNRLNSQYREDNNSLSEEVKEWKALDQSHIQQLEASKKIALSLEKQFLEVTEKLQIAVNGLNAANAKLSAVDAERAVHQKYRKEAEDKGRVLEQHLEEVKARAAQTNVQCERLEAELTQMAIKAREQAETAETTKRSHTLLESRLAHLQGENDEVKRVLASVEIELNACQNHVTSLQKDVSSGNKQVAEAIEARSVLEEALGRVRADLKKQSSEYKALEGSHGDLQRKIDQAWKDIMTLSRSYISTLRHWQTGVDNLLLETRSGFGGFADQHLDGIVLQLKAAENVRPTPPSCSFLQEVHGAWRKRKRAALEGRRDHDTVPQEPDWPGTALGPDVVQPFIEQLTAAAMDISGRLDSLEGKIHELFDLSGKSMGIVLEAAVDAQRRTKETMKKCLIKASMHSVTAFKPEEALSLMDMDSRQDREIQSFLSDIAAAVQGTMELLKDKQHKTETDLLCAEGKIEALVSIRDQQELQIHDLNKALGEVRAHYHDAQEGLAMLEGDRQDAVKKMEEAAMKLRIETRESDNLREDVKAGLKRIGELEAEVERLERLEAAACQAQKRAMEMGAEKFFKHRQGWRQIIETVGRINEGVSILKGETTGSLDCLREVCEGFFKRCELRMVELARQKHDADLALEQITSKRQQRSNDTSKRAGPGPTNLMSEVLGNDRADTVSPGMDDASSHVQQEGAPIAD